MKINLDSIKFHLIFDLSKRDRDIDIQFDLFFEIFP